jgi:hypothetical protein
VTEIGRLLHDDTLQGHLQMTLKAEGPPEALEVQTQLRADAGQVALQSRINMAATPIHYDSTLDITRLNLAALVQRTALQSDLNLRLRLEGQGLSPAEMHGKVRLDMAPSHVGTIALRPSQIDLAARPKHLEVRRFTLDTSVARLPRPGRSISVPSQIYTTKRWPI